MEYNFIDLEFETSQRDGVKTMFATDKITGKQVSTEYYIDDDLTKQRLMTAMRNTLKREEG